MSIDNIQLPGFLCQKMFGKSLLDLTGSNGTQTLSPKMKIHSLGENEKNILFLVNNAENKFLADDEMKLLFDLLAACRISMTDIALVNYNQYSAIDYEELIDRFQSKKILMFGVTTSDLKLPFTIPFFQIQKYQEQLYMAGPPLSDFIQSIPLKKELWTSLKKIFLLPK